jgi:iron complex outermembrane recepter protein
LPPCLRPIAIILCLAFAGVSRSAGQNRHDTVVVTGRYDPVPLEDADRSVSVIAPGNTDRPLYRSLYDALLLAPSVDLRRRSPDGVQGDLSIRGSTFGQTLVLLDGIRVNDAQTGHHNLDLPVSLDAVDRIEVLRGSGSTLYGSDAVGGVLNVITRRPQASELLMGAGVGNFGVNQQRIHSSFVERRFSQQFSASRDFSSGFLPDRDYRQLALSSDTAMETPLGLTHVLLATADKPFGAAQFYGNFNSWERTRTWFASLRQQLGKRTDVFLGYRRHSDLFVLYRDNPEAFTNRHVTESYDAGLRRRDPLSATAALHYGVEMFHDAIGSNNLGDHSRWRAAAYTGFDVRALKRASLTLGVREEVWRKWATEFSPTAAAGLWISGHTKLRASVSRAFRVPAYTDLYYHDPANAGSPSLRPERAWSAEAGASWWSGGNARWNADAAWFERRERDGIDYVRGSAAYIWRATNIQSLRFQGLEAGAAMRLGTDSSQRLGFDYTYLHGARQALAAGIESRYVFNYPSNTGLVTWIGTLPGHIAARTRVGATKRLGRDAYAVWDQSFTVRVGRYRPYLQFSNLSGTSYQEIPGVAMPGRSFVAGLDVMLFGGGLP